MAEENKNDVLNDDGTGAESKVPDEKLAVPDKTEKVSDITPPAEEPKSEAEIKTPTAEKDKEVKDTPESKRQSRQPKTEKPPVAEKSDKAKSEKPKPAQKSAPTRKPQSQSKKAETTERNTEAKKPAPDKAEPPPPAPTPENVAPEPEPPRDASRINETEIIVYIDHSDLHPFKNHPFQVRDDDAMKALVDSVKERGVDQAAIVRPRDGGGYEIVAGHRRQHASEQAGIKNIPCIVRNMTDDEAILAMTESNFNQRSEILASERAQALKMQLDAIKRQGERFKGVASGDVGKRSNEIIAERNKMSVKTVQRYIALNNLVPDLLKFVDDKKIPFTAAVEMSYIKPKNQEYIAITIEAQDSAPSLAQSQRMRELDMKGVLNGDVIDGIMLEEKKEEIKVIITGQELAKYFAADKSPREIKDTILKLLDEHKAKQPPELGTPNKNKDAQEK